MMRIFFVICLSAFLTACATPYESVYVNDSDYYISEKRSSNGGVNVLGYAGVYPWWDVAYYSPYFYPYYFSLWRPYRYDRWYGWYGAYYPHWCSPYMMPRHRRPAHFVNPALVMDNPALLPPVTGNVVAPVNLTILRNIDEITLRREQMNRGAKANQAGIYGTGQGYKTGRAKSSGFSPRYSSKSPSSGISGSSSISSSRISSSSMSGSTGRSISSGSRSSGSIRKQ